MGYRIFNLADLGNKTEQIMMYETNLFDAFTGINPADRAAVIRFLARHGDTKNEDYISEAVDYAVKVKPSFGGFILTMYHQEEMIASLVANKTGMEGYNPKNLFAFVAFHRDYKDRTEVVRELIQRAINHADGDIALHVEPDNPALLIYQEMGFQARYLELRLQRDLMPASA